MTTPEFDAAIRASCADFGVRNCTWPSTRCERSCAGFVENICAALRSLATPTPEVIEAMARAYDPQGWAWYDCAEPDDSAKPIFHDLTLSQTRAALIAYWAIILGETK